MVGTSDLNDVWGSGPNDVWVVGYNGKVLRWNGSTWAYSRVATTSAPTLHGVWGSGPNDVWVASSSGLYHWEGTTLAPVTLPAAASLQDVWAVGPTTCGRWAMGARPSTGMARRGRMCPSRPP